MRPDEFGQQIAAKWERAEQIKRAFDRGRNLEKVSRKKAEASSARSKQSVDKLKAKLGG